MDKQLREPQGVTSCAVYVYVHHFCHVFQRNVVDLMYILFGGKPVNLRGETPTNRNRYPVGVGSTPHHSLRKETSMLTIEIDSVEMMLMAILDAAILEGLRSTPRGQGI